MNTFRTFPVGLGKESRLCRLNAEDYEPSFKLGAKLDVDVIKGQLGLPYIGNIYYVDPSNGDDSANDGSAQNNALKTVRTAYGKTTNNNHDVVVVVPGGVGSGTGTSETANIAWSNNLTHLIGNVAPMAFSHRARIVTTTDSVDPCWTISGQGNIFANVQIATYQDNNDVLVSLTSNRNYFKNVHFAGIGTATCGDDTTARCLSLSGAEENYFYGCTIGLDTIARSVANAEIELASGSTRNVFEKCRIVSFADNAGHLFVKAASAADVDRFVEFNDCLFYNAIGSTATTMTVGMDLHASLGGLVLLRGNTSFIGCTDIADDFTNVRSDGLADGGTTAATANLMLTNA